MTYRRLVIRTLAMLAVLALAVINLWGVLAGPTTQGANLLANPGFEQPFVPFQNDTTRQVAEGWSAWHVPQRAGDEGFRNLPPEYEPATAGNPDRVIEGNDAQEYFSFFSTHTGGVFQQVLVPANARVRFTVQAYVWSTDGEDLDTSIDPGRVQIQVGIDTSGGTNGENEQIIWSTPLEYYDEYRTLSVEADADGTQVTVFVRSTFDLPQQHNNVYLDDASLQAVGEAAPTDTPTTTPTATATATGTQAGPSFPTPTQDVVAATATNTPTPGLPPGFLGRVFHTVTFGDTVSDLADTYGSTIDAIIQYNGLTVDGLIVVGQQLLIPVRQAVPTPTYLPTQIGILPTNTPVVISPPTATPQFGTGGPVNVSRYTVQPGDTLNRLSLLYNVTVEALAQLNGIVNPNLILVGQIINIPIAAPPVVVVPPTATPLPVRQPVLHVVQRGENLFRIALRYRTTVEAIAEANGIRNINYVIAGQRLTIP